MSILKKRKFPGISSQEPPNLAVILFLQVLLSMSQTRATSFLSFSFHKGSPRETAFLLSPRGILLPIGDKSDQAATSGTSRPEDASEHAHKTRTVEYRS